MINNNNNLERISQQEAIEILKENGIKVIMKPVALLPDNLAHYSMMGMKSLGYVETDIFDALNRLQIRHKVIGDPFKD